MALRHLLPNVLPLVLPQLPLIFTSALLIEAGLCFLGAGDPNRLSWGILIQTGQSHPLRAWWLALFAGLALALTSLGLTLLAVGPRKELDVLAHPAAGGWSRRSSAWAMASLSPAAVASCNQP